MMPGAPERMMKMGQHCQAELEPTTVRLTAERLIAASRCKHNYLDANKAGFRENWGDSQGSCFQSCHKIGYKSLACFAASCRDRARRRRGNPNPRARRSFSC